MGKDRREDCSPVYLRCSCGLSSPRGPCLCGSGSGSLALLLLQQPRQLQGTHLFYDYADAKEEEFEDYLEELDSTGPTKPPIKTSFQRHTIISPGGPLTDPSYCDDEIKMKNVHNRFHCVKEHFFILISYKKLQQACYNLFVQCKNGVKKCHRSKQYIEAVYCNLMEGSLMSDCVYTSAYLQGFALITCRWQNDIKEIVPVHVNGIMVINHYQKSLMDQEGISL